MYTLAHVSDWHGTLPRVRLAELLNKRCLGWLSWHLKRRRVHRPEVLGALFKDLKSQRPDHVAVTGDLTNLALPIEFEAAAAQLADLGPPDWVSLVPGNHDAYVPVEPARGWDLWAEYMATDDSLAEEAESRPVVAPQAADFPTVRVRGPMAFVGVCSAQPTPAGHASGRVGRDQLDQLAATLAELRMRELCRVVLIHHPVNDDGFSPRRRLRDSSDLRDVLREVGADLVLHGHGHRTLIGQVEGPEGPIPVVGVRSASHTVDSEERRARYHLFRVRRIAVGSAPRFGFELSTRGYDDATGAFETEEVRSL